MLSTIDRIVIGSVALLVIVTVKMKLPPGSGRDVGKALLFTRIAALLCTTTDSLGPLHTPVTGALLASPPYDAIHRYTPATVGVNEPDV
jgi:hypothetical protein